MTTERYEKKKMVNITIGFSDINTEEKNYAKTNEIRRNRNRE